MVEQDLLDAVESTAAALGVTVASCINEALKDWLENVAQSRLEFNIAQIAPIGLALAN